MYLTIRYSIHTITQILNLPFKQLATVLKWQILWTKWQLVFLNLVTYLNQNWLFPPIKSDLSTLFSWIRFYTMLTTLSVLSHANVLSFFRAATNLQLTIRASISLGSHSAKSVLSSSYNKMSKNVTCHEQEKHGSVLNSWQLSASQ